MELIHDPIPSHAKKFTLSYSYNVVFDSQDTDKTIQTRTMTTKTRHQP